VSFAISMCSSRLQEYMVRMDVINRTPSESFVLHQLSCVGSKWAVSALPSCNSISSVETVFTNQSLSCFFKIKVMVNSLNKCQMQETYCIQRFYIIYALVHYLAIRSSDLYSNASF
jgi:hypothetical protein